MNQNNVFWSYKLLRKQTSFSGKHCLHGNRFIVVDMHISGLLSAAAEASSFGVVSSPQALQIECFLVQTQKCSSSGYQYFDKLKVSVLWCSWYFSTGDRPLAPAQEGIWTQQFVDSRRANLNMTSHTYDGSHLWCSVTSQFSRVS